MEGLLLLQPRYFHEPHPLIIPIILLPASACRAMCINLHAQVGICSCVHYRFALSHTHQSIFAAGVNSTHAFAASQLQKIVSTGIQYNILKELQVWI